MSARPNGQRARSKLPKAQPIPAPDPVPPGAIIRPIQCRKNQITSLWQPGVALVETIYDPINGLRFAVREPQGITYCSSWKEFKPLPWVAAYARKHIIWLPSQADAYGTTYALLQRLREFIHRYFECEPDFDCVTAVYAMFTWVYELFQNVPYLRFLGEYGTGKTRGLKTVGALSYHTTSISGSVSSAAMYRLLESTGGTLLFDEADFKDTGIGAEIAKILNCGFERGNAITRMEQNDEGVYEPKLFDPFGPKIIAGRKPFEDAATESRCLTHIPAPLTRNDIPIQLPSSFYCEALKLQNQLLQWRFDVLDAFDPNPNGAQGSNLLAPRTRQIMQPLLAVVDQQGGM